MSSYDRQYDFGLRGYRQTTRPRTEPGPGWHGSQYDERAYPDERLSRRVTARYNADYLVGPRRDPYDRAFRPFAEDDARSMQRPDYTWGGTRTMQGSPMPYDYDFTAYADYRARRPNDL